MLTVNQLSHNGQPFTLVQMGPEDLPMLDPEEACKHLPAHNHKTAHVWRVGQGFSGQARNDQYWGLRTNEELSNLIYYGWPKGAEKVMGLAAELRDAIPMPVGTRRKLKWSEQGDSIDMHRVYTGQLDRAWRDMPRQRDRAPRIISIDVNVGQSNQIRHDDLFWSGAAAVALTDALEDAGYQVELYATSASTHWRNGTFHTTTRFTVKRAGEALNVSGVAALTALAATFRYYHLLSYCYAPQVVGTDFGGTCSVGDTLDTCARAGMIDQSEFLIEGALNRRDATERCRAAIDLLTAEQESGEGMM